MTDEHDLPDDLQDRVRRYAERHPDATAAGVIGAVDGLDPSDLDAVRATLDGEGLNQQNAPDDGDVLVNDGGPVTKPDGNGAEATPENSAEKLSDAKSRGTDTPDGDAAGHNGDDSGGADSTIKGIGNLDNLDAPDHGTPDSAVLTSEKAAVGDMDAPTDEDTGSSGTNPTPEADKTGEEPAVEALRDVLQFYNDHVDDTIEDHTDAGEHPDRPTTARDYFTEVRGWDSATVDELLLGWAPPDHVDRLVAYLHDRGHGREAILSTGAVGETDTGGFYATFSGRYVLPYYDENGRPAYAIARTTGGDGGGAKGYGGHPADYQAGKYAKLRHTDDRVPFDEPIYGLDTLENGCHVVVAEGIADAITARERGYSVLSPVAKEFKDDHLDPLADALAGHDVDRMTVVADADGIYTQPDASTFDTIGDAVGAALSPVGAGLRGALRTARKLGERTDVTLRVTLPPAPADIDSDLDEFVTGAWNGDLSALLRSARPPTAFDAYDDVATETDPSAQQEQFDADDYEPTATDADEVTDDIRDIFKALDQLDAQRVAEKTIVDEWLEANSSNRAFRPTWARSDYTGTANYVDSEKWVDTGDRGGYGGPAVMAAIDADLVSDRRCPGAVEGETWMKAVDHLRELGFSIPQLDGDQDRDEDYRRDPRRLDATVDVRRAWDAAGRVEPDALDKPLPFDTTDDGSAWLAQGERVDVVRAVGLAEGLVDAPGEPFEDYPTAYNRARETYGAPLPRYYTTADAIAQFDAVLDVVDEVTFWDLDTDALNSDITAENDEVGGEAVRALNPAWRESDSKASVLVFDNGTVWDADTEMSLDALRFVALDAGLLNYPTDAWAEGEFSTAYHLAREAYGAPLPRWDPAGDGNREHTAQLPDPGELTDQRPYDGVNRDALDEARSEVEELLGEAMTDADSPTVVQTVPATGKTTGAIKTAAGAADGEAVPATYAAPRKELQKQALEKADRWGADARVLPVFADQQIDSELLEAAVAHVRQTGKQRLRDRWAVLSTAAETIGEAPADIDIFAETDDDEADLGRPTCPTADGAHGDAWALAVHIARRLGYTPREIHTQAQGLFGSALPCMCDGANDADVSEADRDGCRYSQAWSDIADPDDPADLLVGSYVHTHIQSARTYYNRGPDGKVTKQPRAVILDEYDAEAFSRSFGPEAPDFATWLAGALRDDIDDRRDMFAADLNDEWVTAWLDGDGDDHGAVADTADTLAQFGELYDARDAARDVRDEVERDLLETLDLWKPLDRLAGGDDPRDVYRTLASATAAVDPERPGAGVAQWVTDDVVGPLERATLGGADTPTVDAVNTDALPIGGDLAGVINRAVQAVEADADGARGAIHAATTALRGGREGCRRLAAWADDGYAHPDAHHLLRAVITPTDADSDDPGARRIDTDSWAFDPEATDGTVVDVVDTADRARTLLDRNGHGAILHKPPARTAGNGDPVPLVGLDATGRRELWATALQEDVTVEDIHDTDIERARFLETALDLRVIQASDRPRPYEGDPEGKDTDGDVTLVEGIAEEYAGITAPRTRDEHPTVVGNPAVVTTKGVRNLLEADDRLDDTVAAWENYGNLTGANDLGDHRLAAILGSQHYGDHAVERFAALAGESVDTSRDGGRGGDLSYGSPLADAYLAHMREDQTMQAILRFARGDSGATVVARTSALRDDLPVVGRGQVTETWSDVAHEVARAYRRLGDEFTVADVRAAGVDASKRHIRRVLSEFADAGYIEVLDSGAGRATVYGGHREPGAGEVELPARPDHIGGGDEGGQSPHTKSHTWSVRVAPPETYSRGADPGGRPRVTGAPPSPLTVDGGEPPG
jgi:hypothetical protein